MGLEATSWDWLRGGLRKHIPEFHILERVENGVSDGMADVNYLIRGVEGWIELKSVPLPVRESTPVLGRDGLNENQIPWHLARAALLGRTWVFVTAMPYRWLIRGQYADRINPMTRDELCIVATMYYDEGWTPREWRRLINALAEERQR